LVKCGGASHKYATEEDVADDPLILDCGKA
jgi:hypothetical protein